MYNNKKARHEALPSKVSSSKPQVMLVDEAVSALHLMAGVVKDEYELVYADSVKHAKRLIELSCPELIVLEVGSGGSEGFAFLNYLKSNPYFRNIPVIVVSSHLSASYKLRAFRSGCVDYIAKPYDVIDLKLRVATHIKIAKLQIDTELLATKDSLTGMFNRRRYNELLMAEWELCASYNQALSLLIIDIDNFKQYNDSYGHAAGDDCLVKMGEALSQLANRKYDLVARYGGEEFVVLLPECDSENASNKAQDALNYVHELAMQHSASAVSEQITISVGVATCYPSSEFDSLTLFNLADEALYKVKKAAKNGYVSAKQLGVTKKSTASHLRNAFIS